jgi:hypothetical protein
MGSAPAPLPSVALNYYRQWLQRIGRRPDHPVRADLQASSRRRLTQGVGLNVTRPWDASDRRWSAWPSGPAAPCIDQCWARSWLAATSQDLTRGLLLLAVYSAGLAVPFLLAAVALDAFLDWFQRFRRYLPWVMRVSGALLIFVGILMTTGEFTRLAGWLQQFTPDVLREKI